MKVQVFLPATIIMSMLMMVLIKVRRDEAQETLKRATFVDIKVRVSDDVLREYAGEKAELKQDIDTAKDQYKETDKDMKPIQEAADKARLEAEKCAEEQKSMKDELDKLETEHTNLKAEFDKENESFKAELEALKKQLQEKSPVCAFVKTKSDAGKLCGEEVKEVKEVKEEEPKKDESKQEAPAESADAKAAAASK
eukprot:XP_011603931.1 PREDICTED: filament-like plant protein 2 isoform X1 [Takifugu rubripes]